MKYQVRDVFTPARPARIAFVDREAINDRLVNALHLPGKQIIVYGHSGSGKTTLLVNKLDQLYERHITTRCMKGVKFDQLVLDAFDQLDPYYSCEINTKKTDSSSVGLSTAYQQLKIQINNSVSIESGVKQQRILPPQLTPQALGKFLGKAKCCWILEDFHKIDNSEKTQLSQLMKIFMDMSDEYEDLKIIALGAVNTARQVVDYDPEMRNRVSEIHVDLMTVEEIKCILKKGEEALNIRFDDDVINLVANSCNGLASVCHHLCLNICNSLGIQQTSDTTIQIKKRDYENALKLFAEESSDSIRRCFDMAVKERRKNKYDNAILIIKALTKYKDRGASRNDLLKLIRQSVPKYPETNLRLYLSKLLTDDYGALIKLDEVSGLYSFADPIYRVFAIARYVEQSDQVIDPQDSLYQFFRLFVDNSQKFRVSIQYQ